MQSLVVQTTVGLDQHPMRLDDSRICALCRRPLDLDATAENEGETDSGSSFMDTNYFRMLADANIALSRRASLQADPGATFLSHSPIGTPTSSSRASLDLDSNTRTENLGNKSDDHKDSPHLSHDALNQGYYERFFVEQLKLGRGYRGSVFLCQHILDGIHLGEYAIKKVAVGDNHDWLVQMLREVHLLERLHHPNIVSYKHAWLENHQLHKFGPEVTCLFILMECANGGNLEEFIERSAETQFEGGSDKAHGSSQEPEKAKKILSARERILLSKRGSIQSPTINSGEGNSVDPSATSRHNLSVTEIWSFFFDICEGLAHLHRLGIIHRDLKPPNLLLSYSDSRIKGSKGERPRILITDFGECEILDQGVKRDRTGATGTLEFLAPELLAVDADGRYTDEFSFKGDMWSLGMVLYYLCYSRLPYSQIDDVDILREEIRGFRSITLPRDGPGDRVIPEELKILIRVLLSTDKSKRPSCDDILSSLSLQRDRMMHGDMDSPVTPIHATTDNQGTATSSSSASLSEQDSGLLNDSKSRHRSKAAAHTLRPPSNPMAQFVALKRRKNRTPVVIADSAHLKLGGVQAGSRNVASPSLNLHKKSKPLGLGLRHMLRRRMMHPNALRFHQHSPSQPSESDVASSSDNALKLSFPANSPPIATFSKGSPAVMGQHQADILQIQQVQARKQAARRSMLGSTIHPPKESSSSPYTFSDSGDVPNSSANANADRRQSKEKASTLSRKRSHGTSRRNVRPPQRESDSSEENQDSDSDSNGASTARPEEQHQQQVIARSGRDPATYWTNLAATHADEISRTGSSAEQQDQGEYSEATTSVSSRGAGRQRGRARPNRPRSIGGNTERQRGRGSMDATLPVLRTPPLPPLSASSPRSPSSSSSSSIPEQFSAHFLFLSLVLRIWFCQRLCNPVMVRPLVLYPVLVLTVVWDRYLLSVLSGKILVRQPRMGRMRKIETGHAGESTEEREKVEGEGGASSRATNETKALRRRPRPRGREAPGSESEDGAKDDEDEDKEGEVEGYGSAHDGSGDYSKAVWQALLSGIAVQLVWIGAIRVFSRNGLCMM
ncbi:putative serine/threonine-protein kinase iks1 [Podila clonocystis]|nr:putative serine/threonine-protein kinase iks1 [Podila clonocystis]